MTMDTFPFRYVIVPTATLFEDQDDQTLSYFGGLDARLLIELSLVALKQVSDYRLQAHGVYYTPEMAVEQELGWLNVDEYLVDLEPKMRELLKDDLMRRALDVYYHIHHVLEPCLSGLHNRYINILFEDWLNNDLVVSFQIH